MIVKPGIVAHFGKLIRMAEANIIKKIEKERVTQESDITSRFLDEIEEIFKYNGQKNGIFFQAKVLRDRGPKATEKEIGADFCGVLHVNFTEFSQSKGFLSQAKKESSAVRLSKTYRVNKIKFPHEKELIRLKDQTDRMLRITPDSYVIIYSTKGFVVVPACSIQGIKDNNIEVYGKPVSQFFKEFLVCFIGDTKLSAPDDESLIQLKKKTEISAMLWMQVKGE